MNKYMYKEREREEDKYIVYLENNFDRIYHLYRHIYPYINIFFMEV